MVDGEASIHNIMGGMESTGGVRLHNHKRKLKQRFDIIKKLGQGTYGKVQLGINKETGQEVAIKTIKKCKIETEADLIRIRREIQIMSSVQHPNIIHIYEVFENREKMVLVMEYAAGGELYDYLSEHKVLSETEARRIFRQISTAVFYCHKHKICHRDLKLENILLDQTGNAKIADFGLSNVFDDRRLLKTFCGSALYASPEIVNGTPYHGPEVDCWSLGVLLYTLVYGAMPFDGTNFKRLVKQISESDYREPKKPSRASPLIKVMLTVNPSQRVDIEKICTHWWVNEDYEQNCLDIAEDLAAQTPVRLDLLLSLVPQSASAEKLLVVSEQVPQSPDITNVASQKLEPIRSHSIGSIMELDQNNSDRRVREIVQGGVKTNVKSKVVQGIDTKRKLEMTSSMEETIDSGMKRKEHTKKKEFINDRDCKTYRSTIKHHSAPIPNSILEETMEIDPSVVTSIPTKKTVDLKKKDDFKLCLKVKEIKHKEQISNKELIKTPITCNQIQNLTKNTFENYSDSSAFTFSNKLNEKTNETQELTSTSPKKIISEAHLENKSVFKSDLPKEKSAEKVNKIDDNKIIGKKDIDKKIENIRQEPKDVKKLGNKSLSLDCDLISDESIPKSSTERRRSKIFETAEKFNQLASSIEHDKPKKIFIPGVNVGGAKLVFERKASLSSTIVPQQNIKAPISKVIIDVPIFENSSNIKKFSDINIKEKDRKRDEEKKRAIDIITGALGKPPLLKRASGSPTISPESNETKKLGLKIPLSPNDVRNATFTVTTPTESKFLFESKPKVLINLDRSNHEILKSTIDEPKKCSKVEIMLKSATLPRPYKMNKTRITHTDPKHDASFRSEVETMIDVFQPQKLHTQRSEVAFPIATTMPQTYRSSSLEPTTQFDNPSLVECIIPIQNELVPQQATVHSTTPPPKPPVSQRFHRSSSFSRQLTPNFDTDNVLESTIGPELIRKSPREYIIPISVEGGGYVTPRSGSLESESKNDVLISNNPSRSRFCKKIGSLISHASEDDSFSSIHRHMHRLRSSRPQRQVPEHADSLSSGEDDDDDGFELLTAENLFSTLLSRVRSLTQRLNVDDNRPSGFSTGKILSKFGSNSSEGFWGIHDPLSRRIYDAQIKDSMNRNNSDFIDSKESIRSNTSGSQQNNLGIQTSSHESLFDMGNSILPRVHQPHQPLSSIELDSTPEQTPEYNPELNLTPCLARRLTRHFIERTRHSLSRDGNYRSPLPSVFDGSNNLRSRSQDRTCTGMRRSNSLLEPINSRYERRSPRRSISLFDDEDHYFPSLPLGRKYRDSSKLSTTSIAVDKIQEEQPEELLPIRDEHEGNSLSECPSFTTSICPETTTSSKSVLSEDTSLVESTSNILDYNLFCKNNGNLSNSLSNKDLHNRLLAAENLIKESKLKNLKLSKYNPNLSSNYQDLDKCDKEALGTLSETASVAIAKRRSCIPSLRLRSTSLTRESSLTYNSTLFGSSQNTRNSTTHSPERSLLSKLFKNNNDEKDKLEMQQKLKGRPRRISRFLRPDFFDTPREESQYVKEKEAIKIAENERRKSRFIKKKSEGKSQEDERTDKNGKNDLNTLMKNRDDELKPGNVKSSFLQTLEKKLEKLRSVDDGWKDGNKNKSDSAVLIKRTTSMGEFSTISNTISTLVSPKNKVNSVLGLFKNNELKLEECSSSCSRTHGQAILRRLRKNPYKGSQSDTIIPNDTSVSKIPTKLSKNEVKSTKKLIEVSKPTEKILLGFKKSPSKEKDKDKEVSLPKKVTTEIRKPTIEKLSLKKSPEKLFKKKIEKTEKSFEGKKDISSIKIFEKKKSSDVIIKKNCSQHNVLLKSKSPDKILNIKQMENENEEFYEENEPKLNKKIVFLTATSENNTSMKSDKIENIRIVKKVIEDKDIIEKEENDNTKKKGIVRVVRKVVKKSPNNSKNKEEKEKPTIKSSINKTVILKLDKNEDSTTMISNVQTKNPENQAYEQNEKITELEIIPDIDISSIGKNIESNNAVKASNSVEILKSVIDVQTGIDEIKQNKEKLKLDFSKIPQRNYRNVTPPRKESSKNEISEIPKFIQRSQSENVSKTLSENLLELPHKETITENKIISDKRIRCKHNLDLKMKFQVYPSKLKNENCLKNFELLSNEIFKENNIQLDLINNPHGIEKNSKDEAKHVKISNFPPKYRSSIDDLVYPLDDTESFDSWSICSTDINHIRRELYSPTSPTYSVYICEDNHNTESVTDRIRRKSFYSRFNDKKNKSSLNTSSFGINTASMTLPRKYNFHSLKEINKEQKNKTNNYTLPNRKNLEKCHSMYSDNTTLFRKSSIERDRYSDSGSSFLYSKDFKLPSYSCGHISSSYDPLKKYLSPTFNFNPEHKKFYSSDFSTNNDMNFYKNSSHANSSLEPSSNSNMIRHPKKYDYCLSGFETKTIAYYEELLAPNNSNYIRCQKVSPFLCENYNKFENGYHNGSTELPEINTERWKNPDKKNKTDLTEGIEAEDFTRKLIQSIHESDDLSSNPLDQRVTTSTVE